MSRKFIAILTASVASLSISGITNAQSVVVNYAGDSPGGSDGVRSNGSDGWLTTVEGSTKNVVSYLASGLMINEITRYYGLYWGNREAKNAVKIWVDYQRGQKPLRKSQLLAMIKAAGEIRTAFERLPPEADRNERMNRELKKLIGLEMNDKSKWRNPIYYLNKKDKGAKIDAVYLPKSARVSEGEELSANLAGDRVSSVNLSDAGGNQKRKLDQPENVKAEIGNAKSEGGVRMRESEIARDGMALGPNLRGLPMTQPIKQRGDAPVGKEKG